MDTKTNIQNNESEIKDILIVSAGTINIDFAKKFVKDRHFDRVIAADAGLSLCREISVEPTDILGDFDSLKNKELLEYYKEKGIPLRRFPTRKDYNDTHLAILYAIDLNPQTVAILGATGTRLDHTLASIGLLKKLCDAGIEGKIIDDHNEIEILSGKNEKVYARRDDLKYFSLLPCTPKVTGIDLVGFSYPLSDAVLYAGESVGVSNELVEETGTLRMKEGTMLVMRSGD